MGKYIYEPIHPTQAIQWTGDNLEEVKAFLAQFPELVNGAFSGVHTNEDPSVLTIVGYTCVTDDVLYVGQDYWVVYTFSSMHDDVRLTTLTPKLFEQCFKPYLTISEEKAMYSHD